jgi:hypothetical protein
MKVEAQNITELIDSPTCPLVYATRNIMAGKELFMDYGEDWEVEWLQAGCHDVDQSGDETIGSFRRYISVV